MSDGIAIRVKGVGKKYKIGGHQEKYHTIRDAIVNSVKAPFRRLTEDSIVQSTNEFWALKDVSFDVHKGEIVGIIGRNGAGKTTLLKILSRVTTPTEGESDIYGRVGSLLEVGTGFHPELTGRENIFLSGSILGMRKQEIDEKFDEIVKFAEIDQFIETPVKRYSSGMYVRLAFAVAAHLDTEILLVDEVLAVGDAAFQRKCLGKMGEVSQEGKTILFVSHNMPAIENLCTRGILLSSGKIIRDSDAKSVINSYLNQTLSRKLLASKSINNNFELSFFTLTDNNQCCDIFKTGDNILFSAEILVPNPIKQTGFGIIINNSRGEKIVIFHNHFECTEFTPVKTKGKFLIEWSQNVLSPGDYSIDALLHDGSMMVAKWDNIGIFTIIPSDYFHTGKFPDPSYYGSIISRTKWKFFNLDSNYSSLV